MNIASIGLYKGLFSTKIRFGLTRILHEGGTQIDEYNYISIVYPGMLT
jgi:hypothetical protein